MQTQNTQVHVGLWHRDFWLLAVASLLVTTAMYLPLPLLPRWMMAVCGCTPVEAAVCVALPGAAALVVGSVILAWLCLKFYDEPVRRLLVKRFLPAKRQA